MTAVALAMAAVLLAANFPLFLIFLLASIFALVAFTHVPLEIVLQTLYGSVDKFALMSVPGFLFAAEVMGQAGMADRLVRWGLSMTGRLPGNLAVGTVATSEFFGALSGSSPATVAAIGRTLYPSLVRAGYGERFSAGLVTASGAVAIVIPPSITMILYSSVTNVSVGALFMAGIIPGLVMGGVYVAYIMYYAKRHKVSNASASFSWKEFLSASKQASWAIGVPILILGGIYTGVFTPTEAAGVSAAYAVAVSLFAYRELTVQKLFRLAVTSSILTAKIFIIVAASGVFSWVLTVGQVPQQLTSIISALGLSPWLFLLLTNLLLLAIGCFVDPNSAVLIMTPLLFPIAVALGVNPVHFGIIMTVNLAIGMYTPPFGLNLFVSTGMLRLPMQQVITGVVPFIAVSLAALAIVTYLPVLSLWIPNLLYGF